MGQLPRERRVTTHREIGRLLGGDRLRGRSLELRWLPAARPVTRATCITPRFGHSAVERNRLRRRLKSLIMDVLLSGAGSRDYLVRASPSAYDLDFDGLREELTDLAARLDTSPSTVPEEP